MVTVTDEDGLTDTVTVTITITGTGDAPVITCRQRHAAAVTEDGAAGGDRQSRLDRCRCRRRSRPGRPGTATYGTAAIDPATGEWTYTLDNGHAAVQELGEGDTLSTTASW